jgi:hypothetical protein
MFPFQLFETVLGPKLTNSTILFMFLDTQWQRIPIRISSRLAQTQMFKRLNRRFVFVLHARNVIEDSLGNLSTVVSAVADQEIEKSDEDATNNSKSAPLQDTTVHQDHNLVKDSLAPVR